MACVSKTRSSEIGVLDALVRRNGCCIHPITCGEGPSTCLIELTAVHLARVNAVDRNSACDLAPYAEPFIKNAKLICTKQLMKAIGGRREPLAPKPDAKFSKETRRGARSHTEEVSDQRAARKIVGGVDGAKHTRSWFRTEFGPPARASTGSPPSQRPG